MTEQAFVIIQYEQICSVDEWGIEYIDNSGEEVWLDFETCRSDLLELYRHPNVRKGRYRRKYLKLICAMKTKAVVGLLSPNGGLINFGSQSGNPRIRLGLYLKIEFADQEDYTELKEEILAKDLHFIVGMFDVI